MTQPTFSAYTYVNPLESTGDGIRIRTILENLSIIFNETITVRYLANVNDFKKKNKLVYLARRRKIYDLLPSNLTNNYFIEELVKVFQLIFDEAFLVLSEFHLAKKTQVLLVHGSMSVAPIFLRLVNSKATIIFDPLANYAQTLYTKMDSESLFRSLLTRLRLGAFLLLHGKSLRCSDIILYPSKHDEMNARKMFKLHDRVTLIVPNPYPISYRDLAEFHNLRRLYRAKISVDQGTKVLIYTAGSRLPVNERAVKLVSGIPFNKNVKLIITGPWEDFQANLSKRGDILITGTVSQTELKGLLAAADIGLAPIFYGSGTFLKIFGYLAAGMKIVATPLVAATMSEDLVLASKGRLYVAGTEREFLERTNEVAMSTDPFHEVRSIITNDSASDDLGSYFSQLASVLESRMAK